MWPRLCAAGVLLALAFLPFPATAGDAGGLIACAPARAAVAAVSVDSVRFGMESGYAWASGMVRVVLKSGGRVSYAIRGKAVPLEKEPGNGGDPSFSYTDFICRIRSPVITSVRNCRASGKHRACEVGIAIMGLQTTYAVSLTADRIKPRLAKAD
jgi:hypothetical protein